MMIKTFPARSALAAILASLVHHEYVVSGGDHAWSRLEGLVGGEWHPERIEVDLRHWDLRAGFDQRLSEA